MSELIYQLTPYLISIVVIYLINFFLNRNHKNILKFISERRRLDDVILECRNPLCESHQEHILPSLHKRLLPSGSMEPGFNLQCYYCGHKSEARYEGKAC